MRKQVLGSLVLAMALELATQGAAQAQQKTFETPYTHVAVVQVKPSTTDVGQWEAAQRELAATYKEEGWPSARRVLQTVVGSTGEYRILTPLESIGDMESRGAPGSEVERVAWVARASSCVESRRTFILENQNDLSIPLAKGRTPVLLEIITRELKPGSQEDFRQLRRDTFLPAYEKAKMNGIFVSRLLLGGSRNHWVVARAYDSWENLNEASGAILDVLGQEGSARLLERMSSMDETTEWQVVRYRPDLSYVPE